MEIAAQAQHRFVNRRPLVEAAFGFCTGILFGTRITGTGFFISLCLFFILLLLCLLWRQRPLCIFLGALLLGMLRMRIPAIAQAPPLLYPLEDLLYRVKQRLLLACDHLFYDQSPLLRAMLWADKTYLENDTISVFRVSGLSHILALSGLHVSFFTGVLYLLIPPAKPRLRFVIVALFLLLYCAIAAFPASLVRASVMCLCFLSAQVFQRRSDLPCALAFAAILILLVSPSSLFDLGFQLSFAAVSGIAMLSKFILRILNRLPRPFAQSLCTTLSATLGVLPLSVYAFGVIPVYSLFANFFLVPLVPFCIIPAFFSVLLDLICPYIAQIPAFVAYHMTLLLEKLTAFIASLPYGSIRLSVPPSKTSVFILYLCLFMLSPYFLSKTATRWKILALLFFLLCITLVYGILAV